MFCIHPPSAWQTTWSTVNHLLFLFVCLFLSATQSWYPSSCLLCPIRKCPNFSPDSFDWGKSVPYVPPQPLGYLLALWLCLPSVCISGLLEFRGRVGKIRKANRDEKGKVKGEGAKIRHSSKHQRDKIHGKLFPSLPLLAHCFILVWPSCSPPYLEGLSPPSSTHPNPSKGGFYRAHRSIFITGQTSLVGVRGVAQRPQGNLAAFTHELVSTLFTKAHWVPTL